MDGKEFYEKTEEFAKKIINLATEEGLTVRELCKSVDTVKGIAYNSMVDSESIEKTDYPSQHIVEYPETPFVPEDSSGTKYSPGSSSIACPTVNHERKVTEDVGKNPLTLC